MFFIIFITVIATALITCLITDRLHILTTGKKSLQGHKQYLYDKAFSDADTIKVVSLNEEDYTNEDSDADDEINYNPAFEIWVKEQSQIMMTSHSEEEVKHFILTGKKPKGFKYSSKAPPTLLFHRNINNDSE